MGLFVSVIRCAQWAIGRNCETRYCAICRRRFFSSREHEIYFARSLFEKNPAWPIIDITGKAIEETASDVLRIYKQRGLWQSTVADAD